jgi:hypothetical protein
LANDKSGSNRKIIRKAFEDSELVFAVIDGQSGWHKLSQCLWSKTTHIRGRVVLNTLYPNLEDFFLDLGVPTLHLEMVYSELKDMGKSENATVTEVVQAIWIFNSFIRHRRDLPDPDPIINGNLFPVRYPDGQVKRLSARTDFAIVDRKRLADAFRHQAKFLDFTFDEVQTLRPFLVWVGLESRYLSTTVREVSALDGNVKEPISSPVRDIRNKAHALFRCVSRTS